MSSAFEPPARVKTKIVATVGPASDSADRLYELIRAGVDIFRLNMAHGQVDWRNAVLTKIRETARSLKVPIAVLADLSGPKIRLGPIPGGTQQCELGAEFKLVTTASSPDQPGELTTTYPTLISELKPGDLLLLADGTVSIRVVDKSTNWVRCRVEQPGEIRSGSGINLPGVELEAGALTDKDREDLRWAAQAGVDLIGLSFVQRAADVRQLRQELIGLTCKAWIVAKIEKPQAVAALDEIIRETDAVMVARGDLGVEIDVARVPVVQKQIIAHCQQARIPVITATQMLESMKTNRLPTRAETTDVANAILDGSDAVMLSAETAMGQYPVETVSMMNRIARETEPLVVPRFGRNSVSTTPQADFTESLVESASRLADQVHAKLMVVATRSGKTARVLSKQRGRSAIIGISDSETTVRQMSLCWGVTPLLAPRLRDNRELVNHVIPWTREHSLAEPGDRVVFIASTNWTGTGHDMIMVHVVE